MGNVLGFYLQDVISVTEHQGASKLTQCRSLFSAFKSEWEVTQFGKEHVDKNGYRNAESTFCRNLWIISCRTQVDIGNGCQDTDQQHQRDNHSQEFHLFDRVLRVDSRKTKKILSMNLGESGCRPEDLTLLTPEVKVARSRRRRDLTAKFQGGSIY